VEVRIRGRDMHWRQRQQRQRDALEAAACIGGAQRWTEQTELVGSRWTDQNVLEGGVTLGDSKYMRFLWSVQISTGWRAPLR
jgi:hypothetical protein